MTRGPAAISDDGKGDCTWTSWPPAWPEPWRPVLAPVSYTHLDVYKRQIHPDRDEIKSGKKDKKPDEIPYFEREMCIRDSFRGPLKSALLSYHPSSPLSSSFLFEIFPFPPAFSRIGEK